MKKLILISIILLNTFYLYAQGIKGKVIDERKEPLMYATVSVYQNGILRSRVVTDHDGNFIIKPLDPGYYTISALYPGSDCSVKNVSINPNQITITHFQIKHKPIVCTPPPAKYSTPFKRYWIPLKKILHLR